VSPTQARAFAAGTVARMPARQRDRLLALFLAAAILADPRERFRTYRRREARS